MLDRVRHSGPARRISAVGSRFVDTFLRDNRVIPPVLALLALLVFAWIVAGLFVGSPSEEPASNRSDVAQTEEPAPRESPAPEVENRDADSYAAYENKDPFRELLAPAEAAEETTGEDTSGEDTSGEDTTAEPGDGGTGGGNGGGAGGGAGGKDTDGDGLSNERENALGLDPRNPDTDGDGIQDGDEEETKKGRGGDSGGRGDGGGGGPGGGRGGLPESGGTF